MDVYASPTLTATPATPVAADPAPGPTAAATSTARAAALTTAVAPAATTTSVSPAAAARGTAAALAVAVAVVVAGAYFIDSSSTIMFKASEHTMHARPSGPPPAAVQKTVTAAPLRNNKK
ncbi:hypothetical protein OC845_006705 [Tilletia horrida]|nr:hypothetical protein OC845_006705 [Tilletia horrida]